jgi:predicted RNase H-like HicB family nuclease
MKKTKLQDLEALLARPYGVEILHVEEDSTPGYYIAFVPEFGVKDCRAVADTREGALQNLYGARRMFFMHCLETNRKIPEPISFCPDGTSLPPPAVEQASPKAPWPMRMLLQEIATRVRLAMEDRDLDIFELAEKLNWTPARLLQWLDGSHAEIDEEDEGTLRDLVQLGQALQMGWRWKIGKAAAKVK